MAVSSSRYMAYIQRSYDRRVQSLLASGSDSRSAQALASKEAQAKIRNYQAMRMQSIYGGRSSSAFGRVSAAASQLSGGLFGKAAPTLQPAVDATKQQVETQAKRVESEIKTQESLAPIRQRRKQQAEQQAKTLRRTTGRQALLASPRGGAGFFGGYFK